MIDILIVSIARGLLQCKRKVAIFREKKKSWKLESNDDSFNTSYLTDSYIVFTLKMESVSKNTIFGLKMMVKSGLEKIILKSLRARR